MELQETQILSLEAALSSRPILPPDASEDSKDQLIARLTRENREMEIAAEQYEANLGAPLPAVREDVEREWSSRVDILRKELEERREWGLEVVRELERERQVRLHTSRKDQHNSI